MAVRQVESALDRQRVAGLPWAHRLVEAGELFLLVFTPLAYGTVAGGVGNFSLAVTAPWFWLTTVLRAAEAA